MPSRMKPMFPKGTEVIYDKKYFGEVTRARRCKGTDFFKYDVELRAQQVATADPRRPFVWIPYNNQVYNVSDYSLEFPPEQSA